MNQSPNSNVPELEKIDGQELVLGLVGAVGTNLSMVTEMISEALRRVNYTPHAIKLTELLIAVPTFEHLSKLDTLEDKRVDSLMTAGNDFRQRSKRGDVMALLGVSKIGEIRSELTPGSEILTRHAYIFRSLKNPAEVTALRDIYGSRFFAVGVYSPVAVRKQRLAEAISRSHGDYGASRYQEPAQKLIDRDEREVGEKFGQNVSDTFAMSDLFVDASDENILRLQINRFVDVLFGSPYITPTIDEYALYHASAAALKSADLSRQVGAVIANASGDILAAGCNEVPASGGGNVWENVPHDNEKDYRDFQIGYDTSAKMKYEILEEVFRELSKGWLREEYSEIAPEKLATMSLEKDREGNLSNARISSIIEYGRIVHAEMSAISSAARCGTAIRDCTLFCTTFPCHMCARHIVAAGIKRVVYIEPYPKSMTKELYRKMISVDRDPEADTDAVRFEPFVGVAPRRYFELFESHKGSRKGTSGRTVNWQPMKSFPKVKKFSVYPRLEAIYISALGEAFKALGGTDG